MFQHRIKKIILLGPKHVGKTSVAQQIEKQCSLPYIDTDTEILRVLQKENKMYESIAEAYKDIGRDMFQIYETQAVKHMLDNSEYIGATGGGLADNSEAFSYIKSAITTTEKQHNNCIAVLLKDEAHKMWERVSAMGIPAFVQDAVHKKLSIENKNILDEKKLYTIYQDYFIQTFQRRNKTYAALANIIIAVENKSPFQIAREICAIL